MINNQEDLSSELEDYLSDVNLSMLISEEEAIERGAIPVTRQFTFENNLYGWYYKGDKYSYFGNCLLTIEEAFSSMFFENKIIAYTGYKVTQLDTTFGITFKIDTLLVQAKDSEWY